MHSPVRIRAGDKFQIFFRRTSEFCTYSTYWSRSDTAPPNLSPPGSSVKELLTIDAPAIAVTSKARPHVACKFIYVGTEKLYVRGVTYGPFEPEENGSEYHTPEIVAGDFALMKAHGINAVRTYTVPPRWLLDLAADFDLYVLVGLPWEQHISFLDDPERVQSIEDRVREGVRSCGGHPAILGFAVGNEIPASIVRWYGPARIEGFLERLYRAAKDEDPEALVTYVNFPTTEYLVLPFVDFMCFNVYLESQETYAAYLARLQNLAGDRPLVMAEIGLDSRRNGLDQQAQTLDWQIRTTFAGGSAGLFLFAWTDEWYRGGFEIEDWDFGLTDRSRNPKPALKTVEEAFVDVPFSSEVDWPRVSVVVCSYNGEATIGETLDAVHQLDYPNYEVIVVDDGSTDNTAAIARSHDVRLIRTPNQGLSTARNIGMEEATGDIVAYLDDDAYPDPHWLTYLAATFLKTDHAAVGGPNISPPQDGLVAHAVNCVPGNPMHVLLSDSEAEHIPGCNFAIRRDILRGLGGFDPTFRIAGDDVDMCWRLQEEGWSLGFHPAGMVWHHRRRSVGAFWRQQKNYGKAEALLETKWPEKYNQVGHSRWHGRVYNGGLGLVHLSAFRRWRVYYGVWGSNLFQSLHMPPPGVLETLPLMPEWYLVIAALGLISALGLLWTPLLWALPLLAFAVGALLFQAVRSAWKISSVKLAATHQVRFRLLTSFLHLMQPLARLLGRLSLGLTPWRQRGKASFRFPRPREMSAWSEQWRDPSAWLTDVERGLYRLGASIRRGGIYDRWDLEVRGGIFGGVRLLMAVEEHGAGRQLLRFRLRPRLSPAALLLVSVFGGLAALSMVESAFFAAGALGLVATLAVGRGLRDCMAAQGAARDAFSSLT